MAYGAIDLHSTQSQVRIVSERHLLSPQGSYRCCHRALGHDRTVNS